MQAFLKVNSENGEADALKKNIERTVAFAALRQMSKLADAENAQDRANSLWAKRFGLALGLIIAGVIAIASIYPGALPSLFRSIAGLTTAGKN